MRRLILAILCVIASSSGVQAQNFFFISQNTIQPGHEVTFDTYQDTVRPIMHRYGASYVSTSLVSVLAGVEAPQIVNFGDMGSPEQVQGFFADADFQAAFPTLLEALDDHLTYAVDTNLERVTSLEHDTLLLMATSANERLLLEISDVTGIEFIGSRNVLMSTRGLGPAAVDETPPGALGIWIVAEGVDIESLHVANMETAYLLRVR
jgi:uncharacterized protein (DUF1330 family)